jgi:hypothetical protein
MQSHELTISFDDASASQANKYASELGKQLLGLSLPDVSIDVARESENTMDFGTTLVVVLGTPAVLAIAKGIQAWLAKRPGATVTVETIKSNGDITKTRITADSGNMAKILEALNGEH